MDKIRMRSGVYQPYRVECFIKGIDQTLHSFAGFSVVHLYR